MVAHQTDGPGAGNALLLGQVQEQAGSEVAAGARALLDPSEVTRALSSRSARAIAGTAVRLGARQALIYFARRIHVIADLMRRCLAPDASHGTRPLLVDANAGYSPMGIHLAQQLSHVDVMEISPGPLMDDKKRRMWRARGFEMPPNLLWQAAHLGMEPLHQVLDGRAVQVLHYNGAYIPAKTNAAIAAYVRRAVLAPGGSVVVPIAWEEGIRDVKKHSGFFRSQVGDYPGVMPDAEAMRRLFIDAGYPQVTVYRPSQIALELHLADPLPDLELMVCATAIS